MDCFVFRKCLVSFKFFMPLLFCRRTCDVLNQMPTCHREARFSEPRDATETDSDDGSPSDTIKPVCDAFGCLTDRILAGLIKDL